ncbi:MAG: hypothetical protein ACI8P3_003627 [Saprospiraceae bacterium]|jgi:hypothetical protein
MIRFLNPLKEFKWKYIFGEIFLIFIGISLAIWFNNWNASVQSKQDKEIVVQKIKEEIQHNLKELVNARNENQITLNALADYKKLFGSRSTEIITSAAHLSIFQEKYPSFFRIKDSTHVKDDSFKYSGETFINLELADLKEIAWKTTQSINIANEFSYECLYELESMYNLQARVNNEIDNAANALYDSEVKKLIRILNILGQLDAQLEEDYRKMLADIGNCR